MNRYRALIAGAWALAAVVALASLAAWLSAVPTTAPGPVSAMRRGEPPVRSAGPIDTAGLSEAAGRIRDHDPFRWERRPTRFRFNPWEPVKPTESSVRAAPRPTLTLAGIVGGPPWTALVEGIPDRPGGALLRVGEEASGIRLVEVHGDTARLSGPDTTWILTPRRAWR